MNRSLALLLAATFSFAAWADEDDGPAEVCVLTATETITAPRKPNIFATTLDCGKSPNEEQARAAKLVNNAMNEADALEIMVDLGYEVETGTTWVSYTGREINGRYVLVHEGEAPPAKRRGEGRRDRDGRRGPPERKAPPTDDAPPADDEAPPAGADESAEGLEDLTDDL